MGFRRPPWQKVALLLGLAWLAFLASRREDERPATLRTPRDEAPRQANELGRQVGVVKPRLLATAFVGIVLFAAGAMLGGALTASAEEGTLAADVSGTGTDETTTTTPDTTTAATVAEGTTTDQAPEPETTTSAGAESPPPPDTTTSQEEGTSTSQAPPVHENGSGSGGATGSNDDGESNPVVRHATKNQQPPETGEGAGAIIWVHRVLPDPTPPARRLSPEFAQSLRETARTYDVRWSLILAVLRAQGQTSRVPADLSELQTVADALANDRVKISKTIRALGRYNRAVGLRALVVGLERAKPRLEQRILGDPRIEIYAAGRGDIEAGRIDVRVLVALRYLVVRFHEVGVSSLMTGHRLFARPGVISAHVDGLAVDVSTLGGISISGHQAPRSVTERAVLSLLRLPGEVQPQQIISLLGLGGASFPLADHYDHIHIGF